MHSEGGGVEKLMGRFKNFLLFDLVNINAFKNPLVVGNSLLFFFSALQ